MADNKLAHFLANLTAIATSLQPTSDLIAEKETNDSDQIEMINTLMKNDFLLTAVPMTTLYILLLVSGVVGNVCTCIVIARHKYMKTATNYYLVSLAISDLLLLILGLPQDVYNLWQRQPYMFGEFVCVLRGLSSEASTNASVLTITAFTIERYLAICHPLRAHTMSKLSRVIRLIIVIWVLALIGALPLALQFGIRYELSQNGLPNYDTAECAITSPISHSFEISFLLFFVIPGILMSVLYMNIAVHLRRSSSIRCGRSTFDRHRSENLLSPRRTPNEIVNEEILSRSSENNNLMSGSFRIGLAKESEKSPIYSAIPSGVHKKSLNKELMLLEEEAKGSVKYGTPKTGSCNGLASRRAVIKMLVAVVVAFFICWTPFHAQRLMATYFEEPTQLQHMIFNAATYISGVTYYLSATINPILYSIMSHKFRRAFKETLASCSCKPQSNSRVGKF